MTYKIRCENDVMCEECSGEGSYWFCPSTPDKCNGCEKEKCETCDGLGHIPLPDPIETWKDSVEYDAVIDAASETA